MAIAALVLWLCTAAAGSYLLITALRTRSAAQPAEDPHSVPVTAPPAGPNAEPHAEPRRARDRYDPPSLTRAKSEPLPGLRALAEFTHPALAIIGLGFWLGYVLTRDRLFAAIGFGVLLGAICAGLTWFAGNTRAAKRTAAHGRAGESDALFFSGRLLGLHAVGAALTLLIVTLIAVRA